MIMLKYLKFAAKWLLNIRLFLLTPFVSLDKVLFLNSPQICQTEQCQTHVEWTMQRRQNLMALPLFFVYFARRVHILSVSYRPETTDSAICSNVLQEIRPKSC